jgi:hypothetical protein
MSERMSALTPREETPPTPGEIAAYLRGQQVGRRAAYRECADIAHGYCDSACRLLKGSYRVGAYRASMGIEGRIRRMAEASDTRGEATPFPQRTRHMKEFSLSPDPDMAWIYDPSHRDYNTPRAKELRERRGRALRAVPEWMFPQSKGTDA